MAVSYLADGEQSQTADRVTRRGRPDRDRRLLIRAAPSRPIGSPYKIARPMAVILAYRHHPIGTHTERAFRFTIIRTVRTHVDGDFYKQAHKPYRPTLEWSVQTKNELKCKKNCIYHKQILWFKRLVGIGQWLFFLTIDALLVRLQFFIYLGRDSNL